MYEATVLEQFYQKEPTPESREKQAAEAIHQIKLSKDGSRTFTGLLLHLGGWAFGILFSSIFLALSVDEKIKNGDSDVFSFLFIDFHRFPVFVTFNCLWTILAVVYTVKCYNHQPFFLSKDIKNLFKALLDKPFEVRVEYLPKNEKVYKVIVEENQCIEGTSHVIKTKSKSITAYIDAKETVDSTVKAIVAIVKKVEEDFIK